MSGETEGSVSGWTVDTFAAHERAMQELRDKLGEERDRRYSEVNIEREKALKIKETADLAALSLAREIQDYKDEKANNLRSQIEGERGHYATKEDLKASNDRLEAVLAPIIEFVAQARGGRSQVAERLVGSRWVVSAVIAGFAALVSVVAVVVVLVR